MMHRMINISWHELVRQWLKIHWVPEWNRISKLISIFSTSKVKVNPYPRWFNNTERLKKEYNNEKHVWYHLSQLADFQGRVYRNLIAWLEKREKKGNLNVKGRLRQFNINRKLSFLLIRFKECSLGELCADQFFWKKQCEMSVFLKFFSHSLLVPLRRKQCFYGKQFTFSSWLQTVIFIENVYLAYAYGLK